MDTGLNAQTVLAPLVGAQSAESHSTTEELWTEHFRLLTILEEMIGYEGLGIFFWRIDKRDDLDGALQEALLLKPLGGNLEDALHLFDSRASGKHFRAIHPCLNPEQGRAQLNHVLFAIAELSAASVKDELECLIWMMPYDLGENSLQLVFVKARWRHLSRLRHQGNGEGLIARLHGAAV